MNDIQTYADEMFNKFVMAQIPMSDFDGYVNMIKRMGVEKSAGQFFRKGGSSARKRGVPFSFLT
jgi:hypothetical protein